jgi:hypothetical protein
VLEAIPSPDQLSLIYLATSFQASAAPRSSFQPQMSGRQLARLAKQASLTSRTSLCSVSSLVTRVSAGLSSQPAAARYRPVVGYFRIAAALEHTALTGLFSCTLPDVTLARCVGSSP